MAKAISWRTAPIRVLQYAFCPNEDEWAAERRRVLKSAHVDIGDYPSTSGMATSWKEANGCSSCMVTLADHVREDASVMWSTIAHESYHVACRVAEVMHDENASEEFMAYLLEEITKNIGRDCLRWLGKQA